MACIIDSFSSALLLGGEVCDGREGFVDCDARSCAADVPQLVASGQKRLRCEAGSAHEIFAQLPILLTFRDAFFYLGILKTIAKLGNGQHCHHTCIMHKPPMRLVHTPTASRVRSILITPISTSLIYHHF
uniref:Secreted protein n=1 Tax=Ascaris lumbricoides TaxID=6252 RepID=A0A0M3IJA5_ASCLU